MTSNPAVPTPGESRRGIALTRLGIAERELDQGFAPFARLAARLGASPAAVIALCPAGTVRLLASHGLATEAAQALAHDAAEALLAVPASATAQRLPAGTLASPLRDREGEMIGVLVCQVDPASGSDASLPAHLADLAGLVVERLELRQAERQARDLAERAAHDGLTGAWNRNGIMNVLTHVHARAMREQHAFGVMLLDTDYFRQGEKRDQGAVADQILVAVMARLKDALRAGDAIGRLGGDQFICVLDKCEIDAARHVAERCLAAVCELPVRVELDGPSLTLVSIRIGLLMVHPNAEVGTVDIMLRVDELLDQARQDTRRRVVVDVLAPGSA